MYEKFQSLKNFSDGASKSDCDAHKIQRNHDSFQRDEPDIHLPYMEKRAEVEQHDVGVCSSGLFRLGRRRHLLL